MCAEKTGVGGWARTLSRLPCAGSKSRTCTVCAQRVDERRTSDVNCISPARAGATSVAKNAKRTKLLGRSMVWLRPGLAVSTCRLRRNRHAALWRRCTRYRAAGGLRATSTAIMATFTTGGHASYAVAACLEVRSRAVDSPLRAEVDGAACVFTLGGWVPTHGRHSRRTTTATSSPVFGAVLDGPASSARARRVSVCRQRTRLCAASAPQVVALVRTLLARRAVRSSRP